MSNYSTISIPREVKKRLERLKGNEDWGSFLLKMSSEYERIIREKAFNKILENLSEDDIKSIEESMREFRKNFKLR